MKTQHKIFVQRRFHCSVPELFHYLVQPNLLAQWFGPRHLSVGAVRTEVRVGGKYSIELRQADERSFTIEGEYIEVDEPYGLTFTFEYRGLANLPPKSVVKIQLEELAEGESLLSLTQDFEWAPSDLENRTHAWEYMLEVLGAKFKTT